MIAFTKAVEDKAVLAQWFWSQGAAWSGDRIQLKIFVHPVGGRDESSGVSKLDINRSTLGRFILGGFHGCSHSA
jgi:hypothetical protein